MTLWLLTLTLLLALTPPTLANDRGDQLEDRKNEVTREVKRAHEHLHESTQKLVRAREALDEAKADVRQARDVMQTARHERLAAALVDDRAQATLDAAEAELAATERRVAQAARSIDRQEDELRRLAVESYQSGDTALMSLSMVFTTDEAVDLVDRLGSARSIVDREAAALGRLEATRAVLDVQRARLEETRDAVAERRDEAAETLEQRAAAEARAEAAKLEVQRLADIAKDRKADARKARADDLKQLRKIRKEQKRVERMLDRYYAKMRRQARRDARVAPSKSTGLMWPTPGWISSPYGMRRHPIYRYFRLHDGIDIASNCGRPVRASAGGRVVARYSSGVYGKRVVIGHGIRGGKGLATVYNHMSRFSTFTGQKVKRGDVIGFVGSTGWSTGCHNHFMVLRDGRPVNPSPWLR